MRLFSAVLSRFGSFGSVLAIQDCQIRLAKVKSDNLTYESRRYFVHETSYIVGMHCVIEYTYLHRNMI